MEHAEGSLAERSTAPLSLLQQYHSKQHIPIHVCVRLKAPSYLPTGQDLWDQGGEGPFADSYPTFTHLHALGGIPRHAREWAATAAKPRRFATATGCRGKRSTCIGYLVRSRGQSRHAWGLEGRYWRKDYPRLRPACNCVCCTACSRRRQREGREGQICGVDSHLPCTVVRI